MIVEGVQSLRDTYADTGMAEWGTVNADIVGSPTYNMRPETQTLENELVENFRFLALMRPNTLWVFKQKKRLKEV